MRTNLAMRVLMACAVNPGQTLQTGRIAEICNCSVNHLAHVVKSLSVNGYVISTRGRAGGLQLARPATQTSVGKVFRLFEGDIPLAECFDTERNTCPLSGECRLRNYLVRALDAFYHELDMVTLDDLVRGNCGLQELLALHPAGAAQCQRQTDAKPA